MFESLNWNNIQFHHQVKIKIHPVLWFMDWLKKNNHIPVTQL